MERCGDFFVRQLFGCPHEQGRAIHFRQQLQIPKNGVEFVTPLETGIGAGPLVGRFLDQIRSTGMVSSSLQIQVPGNREQITDDGGQIKALSGGPESHKRLRRQVLSGRAVARQGQRKPVHGGSVLAIKSLNVGHL